MPCAGVVQKSCSDRRREGWQPRVNHLEGATGTLAQIAACELEGCCPGLTLQSLTDVLIPFSCAMRGFTRVQQLDDELALRLVPGLSLHWAIPTFFRVLDTSEWRFASPASQPLTRQTCHLQAGSRSEAQRSIRPKPRWIPLTRVSG